MDELLRHYNSELGFLRDNAKEFAERYPRVAGRLQMANGVAEDPHVERMIESFALLAARVHKRLDDDFPLFTEAFLDVLYPHYLRPFPPCSVAQFDLGEAAGQMTGATRVERGTTMATRPVRGVACKFRTAYDVKLAPVKVASVSYRNSVMAPDGTRVPAQATAVVSVQLDLLSPQATWAVLGERLRFYLDGEASQVSVLREALTRKVATLMVQTTAHGPWHGPYKELPTLAGFAEDEALIDFDSRSHPAYRLLTEYFAFPEKFNFVDVPLPRLARPAEEQAVPGDNKGAGLNVRARSITLHFLLRDMRSDSDDARALEAINVRSLALGCAPVVNLFQQPADPIRITHTTPTYPVLVDSRRGFGYEVYSVDQVFRVRQTPHGESIDEFHPFFSLRHDDLLGVDDQPGERLPGRYWSAHRDPGVAERSPGYEFELSLVDVDFDPSEAQTDTLSLEVTATNRDLPSMLSVGTPGGDLFLQGGSLASEIKLLRKPTPSHRLDRGGGALWRLISHLSLNHLSLTGGGLDALKEMMRLYDLPRSATNRRQVDGLTAVEFRPATTWLPGQPFATFVRGTEVRLTVKEEGFVGTGLSLFAAVLDQFFGLYVHINSFTQLTLVSARTQEEIIKCPPRNGANPLV